MEPEIRLHPGNCHTSCCRVAVYLTALIFVLASCRLARASTSTAVTLSLTSDGTPVTVVTQGSVVTLTATVSGGSQPITAGQVEFCDAVASHCSDIHLLATVSLTQTGAAVFNFRPGPGGHTYQAIFLGTTSYGASSSAALTLSVNAPAQLPTETSISATGGAAGYTLTASVGGNGSTGPSGMVSFLDTSNHNAILGSSSLGSPAGFSFISASYPLMGDAGTASGDFNGDGIPDLIVTTAPPSSNGSPLGFLTVMLGNGDGTFTATASTYPTGIDPISIAVGDFNQDGRLDLAVANAASNNVTLLLGNGDGTFTATASSPSTQSNPDAIVAADFNRDGILDLAVSNGDSNNVSILFGNGDGTFTPAPAAPVTGLGPDSITAGDFNGDGVPDLAIANAASGTISVLLGNGDGTFRSASIAVGPTCVAITTADFNGDGILDLAAVNQGNSTTPGSVSILLGNGDGTFHATAQSPAIGVNPDSIAFGDFNGDGMVDLAVANEGGDSITILLGVGNGTFSISPSTPASSINPGSMAAGDFTGNGLTGLAVANQGSYNGGSVYQGYGLTVVLPAVQSATTSVAGIVLGLGPHAVVASYPGDNTYAASRSAPLALNGPLQSTTLTVTVNAAQPIPYGQSILLTATLAPASAEGHSTDGETITFSSSSGTVGTATLAGGVATLQLPFRYTTTITASFAGDPDFAASISAPLTLTGDSQATALGLSAEPGGALLYGQSVTLVASLTPFTAQGRSTDGEMITFSNGQTAALSGGLASIQFPFSGASSFTANYPGDANFSPSASNSVSLIAAPPVSTTLAVSASPSTVMYGQAVTFTGTLTPGSALGVNSAGTVTFFLNGQFAAQASLASGKASITLTEPSYSPFLPGSFLAGSYTLTAQYSGNSDFSASEGQSPVPFVVQDIKTQVALISSANPSLAGSPVTFTATVSPGGINPQDGPVFVNFYDGTTQICGTAPNGSGVATCTVSTLAPGLHSITAMYSGNTVELAATSPALAETIQSFTLAPGGGISSPPSQTAAPGGQASYAFTVATPASGAPAPITFSVTGLPTGATASFTPATIPAGSGPTTVTMTVTVPAQMTTSLPAETPFEQNPGTPLSLGMVLLPFAAGAKIRRRGFRRAVFRIVVLAALAVCIPGLGGCGSGSYGSANGGSTGSSGGTSGGSGGSGGGTNPPAQAQTYTLTITATTGSQTETTMATLIVS